MFFPIHLAAKVNILSPCLYAVVPPAMMMGWRSTSGKRTLRRTQADESVAVRESVTEIVENLRHIIPLWDAHADTLQAFAATPSAHSRRSRLTTPSLAGGAREDGVGAWLDKV